MKKKPSKKNNKQLFLTGAIILIIILAGLGTYAYTSAKQNELDKIYNSFTCPCCESSLQQSKEFCATGIKEEIKNIQSEGFRGEELFYETVQMMGILNIIDPKLKKETLNYFRANVPKDRAIISLNEKSVDFGNVSESKDAFVMKDFTITNIGTRDLLIYNIGTSCSCLTTKLVTEELESPALSRFSFPYGMTVRIPPGKDMRLRVTYDARVNSFFRGYERRFVYVHTNDVVNPTYQVDIEVVHTD